MLRSLLFLLPALAFAQTAPRAAPPIPVYEAAYTKQPPRIDGRLDDPAWQQAKPVKFSYPWAFQTGPRVSTTARILWDDENLYVAYDCEDGDITAVFTERDDPTYRDDAVEIFINPKPEQNETYYGFEMNARAVMYDYFCVQTRIFLRSMQFDGLRLATKIDGTLNMSGDKDRGWTLEVAIPWRNFRDLGNGKPPAAGDTWTANMNRWDGTEPNRALSQWSDVMQERANPHYPQRFGKLVFVR